jgi:hypothetical protein
MSAVEPSEYEPHDPTVEATEVDRAEQATPAGEDVLDDRVNINVEADDYDVLEQSRVVPDDEDHHRG